MHVRWSIISLFGIAACANVGGGTDSEDNVVAEAANDSDFEQEELGQAAQEVFLSKTEVTLANSPSKNLLSSTAAFIKAQNGSSGNSEVAGNALIAFARAETSGTRVGWVRNSGWTVTTPLWSTPLMSDSSNASIRWPRPDNACDSYTALTDCGGPGPNSWATAGKFGGEPIALSTGLDGVAAIVSTCGTLNTVDEDVCITTSRDGGGSFRRSLILSIPSEQLEDTAGAVDPESVHASTAFMPQTSSGIAGQVSLPIYVTWRNFDTLSGGGGDWWFTRVLVGVDGTIAESSPPRRLNVIADGETPSTPNKVTIFGTSVLGLERIYVAFSEHADTSLVTCNGPAGGAAPDPTDTVNYFVSQSNDLGQSFGCFSALDDTTCFNGDAPGTPKTLIATEPAWQRCVGPDRLTSPTSTIKTRTINSSRIAVGVANAAINNEPKGDGPNQFWFFALGRTFSGKQRIQVYRAGGFSGLGVLSDTATSFRGVTTSPDVSGLIDSWSPTMTVMQKSGADQGRGALIWRNGLTGGGNNLTVRGLDWRNQASASSTIVNLFDVSAARPFENKLGTHMGLATYQGCSGNLGILFCPNSVLFNWPTIPFFATWSDGGSAGTNYDIRTRGFDL